MDMRVSGSDTQPGYFVLSLDTELAFGHFDRDAQWPRLFSPDGSRERAAIQRLLELCEAFGVRATWAVVGHLFHAGCEHCPECPIEAWQGRYSSYAQIYERDHPLWYGADVLQWLLAHRDRLEIGFHGYTHRPFTALSAAEAAQEARLWQAVAARHGIEPGAVVFPRNAVAHLAVLRQFGFRSFRSADAVRPRGWRSTLGAPLKLLSQMAGWPPPETHAVATIGLRDGLVELPPSAYLFDIRRSVECLLDGLGLQRLRLRGIVAGIRQAAATGRVIHLWAHPWEFRTEADFDKLAHVLAAFAEQRMAGRMRSVTMSELAALSTGARQAASQGGEP